MRKNNSGHIWILIDPQNVGTHLNCGEVVMTCIIPSTDDPQFTWLWRWLPLRLLKRQSLSTTTVLFRTILTSTDYWYYWVQTIYSKTSLAVILHGTICFSIRFRIFLVLWFLALLGVKELSEYGMNITNKSYMYAYKKQLLFNGCSERLKFYRKITMNKHSSPWSYKLK